MREGRRARGIKFISPVFVIETRQCRRACACHCTIGNEHVLSKKYQTHLQRLFQMYYVQYTSQHLSTCGLFVHPGKLVYNEKVITRI